MVKEENWAADIRRIRAFFREQPDVTEEQDSFRFRDCRISLTEWKTKDERMWATNRTVIRMEGSNENVEMIYHRFFLRFLSAGG